MLRIPKYSKFVEYSKILQLNTELGFVRSLVKHITLVWANGTSVNESFNYLEHYHHRLFGTRAAIVLDVTTGSVH